MCSYLGFALVLALFTLGQGSLHREKRFLSPDTWARLPSSLLQLSDRAIEAARDQSALPTERLTPLQVLFGVEPVRRRGWVEKVDKPLATKQGDREREDDTATEVVDSPPPRPQESTFLSNPFALHLPFSFGLFTPWWKGPNICVERDEVDESEKEPLEFGGIHVSFESTQCVPSESMHICTKRIRNNGVSKSIIIKRQCCHGFIRRTDGKPGCIAVAMDNLMESMKKLDASKFVDMVESSGLGDKLLSENFTVFAPSNDAVMDLEEETENNEILDVKPQRQSEDRLSFLVEGHIAEGFLNADSIDNDHVIQSTNGRTTIRINKYPSVLTANCVPVLGKNNFATNGIVHLTSDVLPMPRKTLADLLADDPRLSTFNRLLSQSGLLDSFKDSSKAWTLFAPSDRAFQDMDQVMLTKLESGEGCQESILQNHVVKGTLCSSAIVSRRKVENLLGRQMKLSRDESEKLTVDEVRLNETNILGTNGVIHIMEEVLVPQEAQNVVDILNTAERTDLLALIESANLISVFENLQNATFFAPSKDAIKSLQNETLENWRDNPDQLREVLLYHVAQPEAPISSFNNHRELESMDNGKPIYIQIREMFPMIAVAATAQCALIVNHDNEACGAVLHVIDKVLIPPKDNIMEALKGMQGHSILQRLLESTDLEQELRGKRLYTLLAPTDEAFARFDNASLEELFNNQTMAKQILRMHILPEMLCCSSIKHVFSFGHQFVRTSEGNLLAVHRGRHDHVHFGTARALSCDLNTNNGLIHSVNRVILPSRKPSLFDIDFFRLF